MKSLTLSPRSPDRRERGLTLLELMTVVAIVGFLSAAAVVYVKPSGYARSTQGYADQVAAMCDAARMRAISSQKTQRLEFDDTAVVHVQSDRTGFRPANSWTQIKTLAVPNGVVMHAFDSITHITPGQSPAAGANLPATVDFFPDGSSESSTVFMTDDEEQQKARVAVYRATGTATVYEGW